MSQNDEIPIIQLQKMPTGGSDVTLKKDITPLTDTLRKILALRPVSWYWKTDKSNATLNYGFIAQEVEDTLPNLVSDGVWNDGTTRKFLSVGEMTPYIVHAIKEQHEEVVRVNAQVDDLIATLQKQQEEISRLRSLVSKAKS